MVAQWMGQKGCSFSNKKNGLHDLPKLYVLQYIANAFVSHVQACTSELNHNVVEAYTKYKLFKA